MVKRGHWLCMVKGHLWGQPEGAFTAVECLRCGEPRCHIYGCCDGAAHSSSPDKGNRDGSGGDIALHESSDEERR